MLPPKWRRRRRNIHPSLTALILMALIGIGITSLCSAQDAPPATGAAGVPNAAGAPDPADSSAPATAAEAPLPKLKDMSWSTPEQYRKERPTDWIVMVNQDVLVVEPVSPRPNTLELRKAEFDALMKVPVTQIPLEEKLRKLAELQKIVVILPDVQEDSEFLLETRLVQEILYFETRVLREVGQLLDAGDLTAALELLMFVERRQRDWPGFEEQYRRYLFLEATQRADDDDWERAWLSADSLYQRQSDYLQISRLLGRIANGLIQQAVDVEDYRQARHFLARLQQRIPDHPMALQWQDSLQTMARDTLARAVELAPQQPREAAEAIDVAARIWPLLPGLKDQHRQLVDRYQILRVGVLQPVRGRSVKRLADQTSRRQLALTELRLFEPARLEDGIVRYRSRLIESWEPRDLGREIYFQLQLRRPDWDTRPRVTAGQIFDRMQFSLRPESPQFDARLANEIVRLEVLSPEEWSLKLSRIPLRIESRLRKDLTEIVESQTASTTDDGPASLSRELRWQRWHPLEQSSPATSTDAVHWIRSVPQSTGADGWRIAEIVERSFADWESLLQAMLRGEIDYIPHAEWRDVANFQRDRRFQVVKSALPETHWIQIHPQSVLMTYPGWRRALLRGLDRQQILESTVLAATESTYGRLTNSPFSSVLAAYDSQLRPAPFDELQAASLVSTVRRQRNGELPPLRLIAPTDVVTARAIPALLEQWRRIGVKVELVTDSPVDEWDLAYRTDVFTEPVEDLWTLLTPTGSSRWQDLEEYPHWLRERLWELEQTVDWPTAQRLLHQIQAEFLHEARWLPLWELDQFHVSRRRINGIPPQPLSAYQDVERWVLQSAYPTETP